MEELSGFDFARVKTNGKRFAVYIDQIFIAEYDSDNRILNSVQACALASGIDDAINRRLSKEFHKLKD